MEAEKPPKVAQSAEGTLGEHAATSIQAAHRGHMGRIKSTKKKSSLVIQGAKPQVDFYAQV